MTFPLQTGEVETPAVKNVKATGVNEYRGNVDAVADSSSGAMQSFFRCGMQQDQMPGIIAYVRTLET